MARIEHYMNDGASWQSQAILAYVRAHIFQIEDKLEYGEYKGVFDYFSTKVGRYEKCTEQGYVFSVQVGFHNERHYAVYEHKNCDNIIVLIAEGLCMDTPSVDFMWKDKGENASKYDYDKAFSYGQIVECGRWIIKDMLSWIDEIAEKRIENEEYD